MGEVHVGQAMPDNITKEYKKVIFGTRVSLTFALSSSNNFSVFFFAGSAVTVVIGWAKRTRAHQLCHDRKSLAVLIRSPNRERVKLS